MTEQTGATVDVDLWSDDVLTDPYETYRTMRKQGSALHLEKYDLWALTDYESVRFALGNHDVFSSRHGIAVSDEINAMMPDIILHDDGEIHSAMRGVLSPLLTPRALRKLTEEIDAEAERLVESVLARSTSIDAMTDLAEVLPVSVVARLIGLPEDRRMRLLDWADCSFTAFGPMNQRTQLALGEIQEFFGYLGTEAAPEHLTEGSWGQAIYAAAGRGEIAPERAFQLMFALAGAGMDTTISALGSALELFARHPDQWAAVRADPSLILSAFTEVVRLESPIQYFTRKAEKDHDVNGVTVPQGARVVVMYGSANRDERKWADADRFDVRRNPVDQVGFGYGIHACVGQPLARIEAAALFKALAARVDRFELAGEPTRALNNIVRRAKSVPLTVHLT